MRTDLARRTMVWALLLFTALLPAPAIAESDEAEPERTLSPYFLVKGGSDELEGFPLESTEVGVKISGVIADVTVRQTYRNEAADPIEARYIFPASTRAAVHGLRMTIGDRVIEAVVKERAEARRTYEAAKSEGKSATLLEQRRANVFQMNVANILPGDRIEVELRYTELLVPELGIYEFVYPTVVGPRYTNRTAGETSGENRWVSSPYLSEGRRHPARFDIAVSLDGGLFIQDVGSPSHAVKISYPGPTRADVELDPGESDHANRDFILRYRLQDERIQTGLLLDASGDERFFLLMVQPPEQVKPADVPPREYVFVVDVSGSMNGFPLQVSKQLMRGLLESLRPQDAFNVILFSGGSAVMAPESVPATDESIQAAMRVIDAQQGGGGTELLPALDVALDLPDSGEARSIVILTDGFVDVESEAFDRIRKSAGRASVFAFGIGTSVNRLLIEGLAHAGHGEPLVVTGPEEAESAVQRFTRYIEAPLLTDVKIDWGELDVYDVEPSQIPILMAERPLIVTGKWRGRARGSVGVRGQRGDEEWSAAVAPSEAAGRGPNPALRYLWARERLRLLSDFVGLGGSEDLRAEIVALGLRYNLLTKYTSFVAVAHEVRNSSGVSNTVNQPLPLPQGVSEMAVGAPGTPEPATWILLTVAGGAAVRHLRRRRGRS